jgi:hypothetical protein
VGRNNMRKYALLDAADVAVGSVAVVAVAVESS